MVKSLRYGLGNYPEISLDNARKIHEWQDSLSSLESTRQRYSITLEQNRWLLMVDSIKEIEAKAAATKELEAMRALMTFGDAANEYKTGWVNSHWKDPDKGWSPVRLHLLPKAGRFTTGSNRRYSA